MMPSWDAELYLRFADERAQPTRDLLARVALDQPRRIIDLGCGPGNSTAQLRARWPAADITGLDDSAEMIATAAQKYPNGKWVRADIAAWQADEAYDLVFSNAALHWVPDHAVLLPRLFAQVATGGALALQMPALTREPIRTLVEDVANDAEWRHLMDAPFNGLTFHAPEFYYGVLQPLAQHLDIWVTAYYHVLASHQAMMDWFRGTSLRPYLDALATDAQRARFEQRLLSGYTRAYPPQSDGRVMFPFHRLFVAAYR